MSFQQFTTEWKPLIEESLAHYIQRAKQPEILWNAMGYGLLNGGKRLRPLLVCLGASLLGDSPKKVLPAAVAVEMIHSYSLIHDDLPALDNDDFRRGKPSVHKAFSESDAILAGDALLTYAFEVLSYQELSEPRQWPEVLRELSFAAGPQGMCAGQVLDMQAQGQTLADLEEIHRLKTGALIRASLLLGARCAGALAGDLAALSRYGEALGLCFQITDDILDITGSFENLGKTPAKDIEQDKLTYPALLGLEGSKEHLAHWSQEGRMALETLTHDTSLLKELLDWVVVRKK